MRKEDAKMHTKVLNNLQQIIQLTCEIEQKELTTKFYIHAKPPSVLVFRISYRLFQ